MRVVLACFVVICATKLLSECGWMPEHSKKPIHSAAWELGHQDGREACQADAQRRQATIGYGATVRKAPRWGFGADRREYRDGWNAGYSSANAGQ